MKSAESLCESLATSKNRSKARGRDPAHPGVAEGFLVPGRWPSAEVPMLAQQCGWWALSNPKTLFLWNVKWVCLNCFSRNKYLRFKPLCSWPQNLCFCNCSHFEGSWFTFIVLLGRVRIFTRFSIFPKCEIDFLITALSTRVWLPHSPVNHMRGFCLHPHGDITSRLTATESEHPGGKHSLGSYA